MHLVLAAFDVVVVFIGGSHFRNDNGSTGKFETNPLKGTSAMGCGWAGRGRRKRKGHDATLLIVEGRAEQCRFCSSCGCDISQTWQLQIIPAL